MCVFLLSRIQFCISLIQFEPNRLPVKSHATQTEKEKRKRKTNYWLIDISTKWNEIKSTDCVNKYSRTSSLKVSSKYFFSLSWKECWLEKYEVRRMCSLFMHKHHFVLICSAYARKNVSLPPLVTKYRQAINLLSTCDIFHSVWWCDLILAINRRPNEIDECEFRS